MQQKAVLSLEQVNHILDAAQREAEANGWLVTIAVTDDGGHPLALRRMDGCAPMAAYVAPEKARSAALGRRETQAFEDMINGGRTAFLSAPVLQGLLTGGIPVLHEGQVIAAVGVSGVKPEQDAHVARAGIAALAD
ncbi:heme-binding protein [Thioalkalivibrio sp.]|uniref:heme-binding protein n=1 Tax=Thioalkalivibrio sp. TaxID=2093813 RepID=UPI0039768A21